MPAETPLDLKKSINLPKTAFAQKANMAQAEPARLRKWADMDLYGMIRKARSGSEKFILHDGPPYANADIHIGTALNKILKDLVVKSRTMMGYDAPYIPGYDCHGLPIELYVDKKLGAKKFNMPAISVRRACRQHAAEALKRQTRDFQRLGVFGEWSDPYLTMSNGYEAETARLFGRFIEKGYVYKGARPVYWCIHDQTALAEAEVEYQEHTSPSVYVKFPLTGDPARIDPALAGRSVYFLIWTTTPWTLPANLGIAVNPDFDYAAIENGNEVYIVASELVNTVSNKCGIGQVNDEGERLAPKVLARFPGDSLDRLECRHAWLERTSLVMLGEHVTLGGEADAETELDVKDSRNRTVTGKAGTGCVHTAPGHGHDDFVIGKKYGLEIYCPVDNSGRFTPEVEHFAGLQVFEANPRIVEFLSQKGALLFTEEYRHRYPHCWRCHNPVIFRATPQWFVSMDRAFPNPSSEIEKDEDGRDRSNFTENFEESGTEKSLRSKALQEVQSVKWIPSWGQERMNNMLKGRPDWCISRQRVWGVPIPVFYCSECDETVAEVDVVNYVSAIFERESADAWYAREASELLPQGFKCAKCDASRWRKETDILDVWFDSGASSIAVLEQRKNLQWPADLYLEGGDQYRGWFNSSLMVGIAAHDSAPYKTVLTHGWVVDGQGKAMHKSTGNAVLPEDIFKESGAEILRLWSASSDYHEDMRCSPEILARVTDGYRKLRNTARFALGNLAGFDPSLDSVPEEEMEDIDRWALEELNIVLNRARAGYEAYEFHSVYHALYDFCTVTLSARYFDIIKDRLYTYAPRGKERRAAQTVLYRIAEALACLLAPILVFTADEIWENLPQKANDASREASVHLAQFPRGNGVDSVASVTDWAKIFEVREKVLRALEVSRTGKIIGSSLEAKVIIHAEGELLEVLKSQEAQLRYVFIVSQVHLDEKAEGEGTGSVQVTVSRADGAKCERCWNYSARVGESERYPTVCERCLEALSELERRGTA